MVTGGSSECGSERCLAVLNFRRLSAIVSLRVGYAVLSLRSFTSGPSSPVRPTVSDTCSRCFATIATPSTGLK